MKIIAPFYRGDADSDGIIGSVFVDWQEDNAVRGWRFTFNQLRNKFKAVKSKWRLSCCIVSILTESESYK